MNKKTIYFIIIVVAFTALFYYIFVYSKNENLTPEEKNKVTDDLTGVSSTTANDSFPLKNGSRGARVKMLQSWINKQSKIMPVKIPNTPLAVDGIWGVKTEAAINKLATYSYVAVNATPANMYPISQAFYSNYIKTC